MNPLHVNRLQGGPLVSAPDEPRIFPGQMIWATESLAAAVASITIAQAPPLLTHYGIGSRLARIADIESDWFAYWSRELGIEPTATPETWRAVVALQALYEWEVLRPGEGVDLRQAPSTLAEYLMSIGVSVATSDAGAAVDFSGCLPRRAETNSARVGLWFFDLALNGAAEVALKAEEIQSFGQDLAADGWTVAPADFALGVHPLDRFVAASAKPMDPRTPALRHMRGEAIIAPFILVARRGSAIEFFR